VLEKQKENIPKVVEKPNHHTQAAPTVSKENVAKPLPPKSNNEKVNNDGQNEEPEKLVEMDSESQSSSSESEDSKDSESSEEDDMVIPEYTSSNMQEQWQGKAQTKNQAVQI